MHEYVIDKSEIRQAVVDCAGCAAARAKRADSLEKPPEKRSSSHCSVMAKHLHQPSTKNIEIVV